MDATDTARTEALRAALEAQEEAAAEERRMFLAALARARLENRRLRRKLEEADGQH